MALIHYTAFDSLGPRPAPIEFNYDELWMGSTEPTLLSPSELQQALRLQMGIVFPQEQKTVLSSCPETDFFNEVDALYSLAGFLHSVGEKVGINHCESDSRAESQYCQINLKSETSIEQDVKASAEPDAQQHRKSYAKTMSQKRQSLESDTRVVLTCNIFSVGLAGPHRMVNSKRHFTSRVASTSNEELPYVQVRSEEKTISLAVLGPFDPDKDREQRQIPVCQPAKRYVLHQEDRNRLGLTRKTFPHLEHNQVLSEDQLLFSWLALSIALAIVRALLPIFWCRYGTTAPYSLFSPAGRRIIKSPDLGQGYSWVVPLVDILLQV